MPPSTLALLKTPALRVVVIAVIVLAAIVPNLPRIAARFAHVAPRSGGPDWALWLQQPAVLQLHVYTALLALAIGTVVLLQPKGSRLHKTLGWAWVLSMATTATASLFIRDLNGGLFSFIHLFSGWTLVALPMGIYAIRRRNLKGHRAAMGGVFFGGLIIAGALTFLPGRLMWQIFFG